MGINFSISVGHLTAKPELRYFRRDNTPYTRFTVAVNRNFSKSFLEKHPDAQTADFIPCIIKGNYASYLVNHCDKGSLVTVKGRLQSRRYTTETGENRSVLEVNVEEVVIGDYRKKNAPSEDAPAGPAQTPASTPPDEEDEEIPF